MRNIIITGASSGLGAALAKRYAGNGITLGLLGRNEQRLSVTAADCRAAGADVIMSVIDVRDTIKLIEWLEKFDQEYPVDLVIANAGITYAVKPGSPLEPRTAIRDIIDTNLIGVTTTINTVLECMRTRRRGQAVIIGSLAAWRGIPFYPAYAASKAAIRSYYEGVRGSLAREGIKITIVNPGFFVTPMNRNILPQVQMSLEYAANKTCLAIEQGKYEVTFPWLHYFGLLLLRFLPVRMADAIMLRIYGMHK